jgi:hypothetical protein
MTALALALLLEASLPPPRDGMAVRNGAVELALAHRETDRLDGGILTVDPRRRAVIWEGIAGEMGCPAKVEASFDDVRSVAVGEPGFALEFRKGKSPRMLLIPRPHAQWLLQERRVRDNARISQLARDGQMAGPDGESMTLTGSSASTAPMVEHLNVPSAVTADTRAAVDAIRDAPGRTPAPATLIREARYGSTWEASPAEIAETPAEFEGQAVRVRGRFEAAAANDPARLVDESGAAVFVTADPDIARLVAVEARRWPGHTLEVTGVVRRDASAAGQVPRYGASFWNFDASALPSVPAISADAATLKLPELIANPDAVKGRLIRVVGQLRGRNLYGDLPAASFRHRLDWVLKDERAAVWVTGRPPRGRDFKLDGDRVRSDARFVLQFNKYMDDDSFPGHVVLRYADSPTAGGFPMRLAYDEGKRALVIDPGVALQPGRRVECLLLPGIVDADGLSLVPRQGAATPDLIDVLRFDVER